eukprot:CAMPEP_0183351330 /NCGR_PEP_ID=MMETSP0164_2-20130417/23916_1 /TAXON_ID=221442 /ORGANISM="Coccolithus pelagicus ssp braarudi, Strain PLY182g" /LENGTH=57 /DNA_ID=CAMNT_0025523479 /DNA_START=83 /DNA_END=253 /DNA_ORIENTATION=+
MPISRYMSKRLSLNLEHTAAITADAGFAEAGREHSERACMAHLLPHTRMQVPLDHPP